MWTFLQTAKLKIIGALVMICGGVAFSGALEEYNSYLMMFCATATGLGLFTAKPANVTNSPNPAAPVVVPSALLEKPNPVAKVPL